MGAFVIALVGESPETTYLAPDLAPTTRRDALRIEDEAEARRIAADAQTCFEGTGIEVHVRRLA